jgi:protein-disulfide isomerase
MSSGNDSGGSGGGRSSGGGKRGAPKSAARERVRAQHLKDAAARRRKKQMTIAGIVAAVIVVAVGIGLLVAHNSSSSKAFGTNQPFTAPKGVSANPATEADPGGILYGTNLQAKTTLQIWEDVRCPVCKAAEDMLGDTYKAYANDGRIKVEYHLVDLIDNASFGQGSVVGGSALGCAQDVSSADFMSYHNLFYKNQPDETKDGFGSVPNVLNLAGQVEGLRSATFDACVTAGKYAPWVRANYSALSTKLNGSPATPDFYINGTPFQFQNPNSVPAAQQQANLKAALDAAIAKG